MALLLKKTFELYYYVTLDLADPRTNNWFLVKSPIAIASIMVIYLLIVNEIGPKFMENRKPYTLRKTLIVYNSSQILLCLYIVVQGLPRLLKYKSFYCEAVDYSHSEHALEVAYFTWLYFMIKVFDLLDTIFFLLRKKNNQVTFLHVYHHIGMVFASWVATKYLAGGESVFIGYVNSFVHIIMYGYYLISSFYPGSSNTLWWKKYITQLQLVQFFILFIKYLLPLFDPSCTYPKAWLLIFYTQNVLMVILFGNFYYKTYIKKVKT